jgi:RNA recognition motif-containing protein
VIQGQKSHRQDVRVREIWLGNLSPNITERVLYSHFFISGEIEEIEILKQTKGSPLYAFIRFKLTSCAKRAYDLAQNLDIEGFKVKVQFSDFHRRG